MQKIDDIISSLRNALEESYWVTDYVEYGSDGACYLSTIQSILSKSIDDLESVKQEVEEMEEEDDCWIPLCQKRPRAGKWVIVYCKGGFICAATRQKDTDTFWRGKGQAVRNVICWMERPTITED